MNSFFCGHDMLMMFYLLPEEIVARTELTDFPRDPYIILENPKWIKVYESDYFQLVLTDTWAWLVWEHLGIRGGMEQYSGYDPFWQLAHAYPLWMKVFRAMGLTAERYFILDRGDMLRYLTREENYELVKDMAEYFIANTEFKKWRDAIQENRCHEDYDVRRSNVKVDFHRKWYHSRAKLKEVEMNQIDEPLYYPFEKVDSRLDVERFTGKLDEKNKQIVKLMLAGYTQAEIAERLGFANHSGVCKRTKKIGAEFLKYMQP